MIKLSRDKNGNKIVTYSPDNGKRGFSVQTLGNMPLTHRMNKDDFDIYTAQSEFNAYVKTYGTKRQQEILAS